MATNYPSGIDSLTNPSAGDALTSPSHSAQHANANDAIEAIETELGTTPSGSESTVAARLDKIEDGTRLAANSVGATQLADSAVDTAAIQDGAVTAAKLATTGRFTFPTGAANGYGFTSGAVHLSGTGTPEGVITAAPGSTWLQTDSTTDVKGWIKWVKATGTGNTGWVAGPEADTGWRDVAASASGLTGTGINARMRRIGANVQWAINYTATAANSGVSVMSISGFLPAAPTRYLPCYSNVAGVDGVLEVSTTGIKVYQTAAAIGGGWSTDTSWLTVDAWPSSLPGSAV